MRLIFLLITGCCFSYATAQVMDIESKRIPTDSNGFAGSVDFSFSINQYNEMAFNLTNKLHIQYKYRKHLVLALNDISFIKRGENAFQNYGLGHLRYNYTLKDWLKWEVFTQASYNELIRMKLRVLAGTGPRFKLSRLEKYKFYIGTAYMFEYDDISQDSIKRYDHRLSTYFSFTLKPAPIIRIVSTTYYQPKFNDWGDFRISGNIGTYFTLAKNFHFKLEFSYNYDRKPPSDTPNLYYTLTNGLVYRFL